MFVAGCVGGLIIRRIFGQTDVTSSHNIVCFGSAASGWHFFFIFFFRKVLHIRIFMYICINKHTNNAVMAHNEKLMFIALEAAKVVSGLPIQFYSIRLSHDKMYLQADFTEEAKGTIEQAWPNANWHYEDRHHWWVALVEIITEKRHVLCEITLCL